VAADKIEALLAQMTRSELETISDCNRLLRELKEQLWAAEDAGAMDHAIRPGWVLLAEDQGAQASGASPHARSSEEGHSPGPETPGIGSAAVGDGGRLPSGSPRRGPVSHEAELWQRPPFDPIFSGEYGTTADPPRRSVSAAAQLAVLSEAAGRVAELARAASVGAGGDDAGERPTWPDARGELTRWAAPEHDRAQPLYSVESPSGASPTRSVSWARSRSVGPGDTSLEGPLPEAEHIHVHIHTSFDGLAERAHPGGGPLSRSGSCAALAEPIDCPAEGDGERGRRSASQPVQHPTDSSRGAQFCDRPSASDLGGRPIKGLPGLSMGGAPRGSPKGLSSPSGVRCPADSRGASREPSVNGTASGSSSPRADPTEAAPTHFMAGARALGGSEAGDRQSSSLESVQERLEKSRQRRAAILQQCGK